MKSPKFEIIAGTYEEFLLGYNFISRHAELTPTFAIHEHSSSIRCIDTSGHYLASGAADDKIIVYDLNKRKEHCMLNFHNATVNCLRFTHNHSHLISGSADGELAIVRVGSWQLEKMWGKAHKGSAILDIAVHNSGKLALTLGSDCTLRTWNLVKGRQAYAINLNSKSKDARSLEKISWAEDGVRFILSGGKYTEIWSIESGGILKVIEHDVKVSSCIWFTNDEILVGYEDGQIALVEINECTKTINKAHSGRVKSLAKHTKWIISASSSGEIKVWDKNFEELAKHDTGCRVTCIKIADCTVKVKEEDEEAAIPVDEEVIEKSLKKSTVIVEVEESDNESNIKTTITANKSKKSAKLKNTEEPDKRIVKKKKKRQFEETNHEEKEVHIKKRKLKQTGNTINATDKNSEVKKRKMHKKEKRGIVDT